jgi:hypothetical protein
LEYNPQNTLLSLLPSFCSTRGTLSSFSATESGLPKGATRNQNCSEMPQGQSQLKIVETSWEVSKNVRHIAKVEIVIWLLKNLNALKYKKS